MLAGFVPFFNLVLLSGWQMGLVKRMACAHRDLLPETSDLKTILVDGVVVSFMFGLNLFPAIHIEIFLTQPQKSYGWNLAAWIFNGIIGQNTVSFSEIMREGTMTFLAMMLLPGAYLVIAALLFIAAMTSYALTGKASSFFNIAGNVRLIVRYFGDFLLLCFFMFLTYLLVGLLAAVLMAAGLGVALLLLLAPTLLLPGIFWTYGYLAGQLALKARDDAELSAESNMAKA